jgi:anhydro-N-acetylmuramic acid kinase
MELFIGLMSGTSMDGVDGVLIDLEAGTGLRILSHLHRPYEASLRTELLALNHAGENELHRSALASNAIARAYAQVVAGLIAVNNLDPKNVQAIGAHGQTVRHQPLAFDGVGYTIQLLNGSLLAELCGVQVITDFRSRDLAAGGQGAPLVPAFHRAIVGRADCHTAVLNIGGIANITLLPTDGQVSGHDCGPGNVLLDLWCMRHTGQQMDKNGAWGRSGRPHAPLLATLMQDEYVLRRSPKSTGRDHFNESMLEAALGNFPDLAPADVQATLTWFTAQSIASSIENDQPLTNRILVCGGGALNGFLMECLRDSLPAMHVQRIDKVIALDPMHVEAAAFAWLAQAHLRGLPGNLPVATGARGPRRLGGAYPA